MKDAERDAIRKALAAQADSAASSKKAAKDFLVKGGYHTKTGALAPTYGGKKAAAG